MSDNEELMEVDTVPHPPVMEAPEALVLNSPVGRLNETFSVEEKSLANSTYILDAENEPRNR